MTENDIDRRHDAAHHLVMAMVELDNYYGTEIDAAEIIEQIKEIRDRIMLHTD